MTTYKNLTIILPVAAQALAQGLCVAAAGEAGAGMFTTGLSPTGEAPASHFISSGTVEAKLGGYDAASVGKDSYKQFSR